MNEAVETPLRAERIEQALEVFMLLKERRDHRPDASEMPKHRMAAATEREDHRDMALKQGLKLVVFEQRAGLGVVDAEAFAQHAADFDRKALVAPMISEEALGLGQQFHAPAYGGSRHSE